MWGFCVLQISDSISFYILDSVATLWKQVVLVETGAREEY